MTSVCVHFDTTALTINYAAFSVDILRFVYACVFCDGPTIKRLNGNIHKDKNEHIHIDNIRCDHAVGWTKRNICARVGLPPVRAGPPRSCSPPNERRLHKG